MSKVKKKSENRPKVIRKVDPELAALARRGDWALVTSRLNISHATLHNNRYGLADKHVTLIESALLQIFEERKAAEHAVGSRKQKLLAS